MNNNQMLDEMRQRVQSALIQSKRNLLREQYGMQFEHVTEEMPPEVENEWLDYVLEFERQFAQAKTITIRERIGNPPLPSLSSLPLYAVGAALESLLLLLEKHGVAVEFLGTWDDAAAYRYLMEELLDEEIDDIRIEGMRCVFTPTTPEYDVQMWVENFVFDVFLQNRTYFLAGLAKQPLFGADGNRISLQAFKQQLYRLWERLPLTSEVGLDVVTVEVDEAEGRVTAVVTWPNGKADNRVVSTFRLQPSPYTGWDVVQTSLLDDLLVYVS